MYGAVTLSTGTVATAFLLHMSFCQLPLGQQMDPLLRDTVALLMPQISLLSNVDKARVPFV